MQSMKALTAALFASLAAAILAMAPGSSTTAPAPVAVILDKPARPSPIRPGITADMIANLVPPEAAEGVANSAHHA
jgi:hypothetical protein